jgi:hypothetical protein
MTSNEQTQRRTDDHPAHGVTAALLSVVATGGPWFRPVGGLGWAALLTAAVVALVGLRQLVWLYRSHSTRRWKAALDTYAAREIARDRRWRMPPR